MSMSFPVSSCRKVNFPGIKILVAFKRCSAKVFSENAAVMLCRYLGGKKFIFDSFKGKCSEILDLKLQSLWMLILTVLDFLIDKGYVVAANSCCVAAGSHALENSTARGIAWLGYSRRHGMIMRIVKIIIKKIVGRKGFEPLTPAMSRLLKMIIIIMAWLGSPNLPLFLAVLVGSTPPLLTGSNSSSTYCNE
jgi:hypothetical protein